MLEVPRLGPKAFEQAAGFLRIHDAAHPLDASAGHPERYASVLARRFPAIPVFVVPDAVDANVRGFQKIGEAEWEFEAARA